MLEREQLEVQEIPDVPERPMAIRTRGLTKAFGGEIAVNAIDMDVPEGAIFGFIGPSGSGKTTTVRLLMGLFEPDSGELSVLGARPDRFSRHDRERIGYLPQLFVLYPDLTVWENMNFAASLYGVSFWRGKVLNRYWISLNCAKPRVNWSAIFQGYARRLSLAATLVLTLIFFFWMTPPRN